jgi:hypothetical protein
VVAAGLSIRAVLRADELLTGGITGGGLGFVLPLSVRADGLVIEAQVTVEALGFDLSNPLSPAIRTANALRVQASFARESGWLIGGPDPTRGPGPRPEHELRRVEATLVIPLRGDMAASAEVVLIEPKVFGIGLHRRGDRDAGLARSARAAGAVRRAAQRGQRAGDCRDPSGPGRPPAARRERRLGRGRHRSPVERTGRAGP